MLSTGLHFASESTHRLRGGRVMSGDDKADSANLEDRRVA